MIDWDDELGATNVRLTFRTYKVYSEKLRRVAQAHGLRLGRRLSIGAAINLIIGKYDDAEERAKVPVLEAERPQKAVRKQRRTR